MKLTLLLCLMPFLFTGQILIQDSFNDSNYVSNPTWTGSDSVFIINANKELQLSATVAGSAYLAIPSAIGDSASWEFEVFLDFNPSASNYAKVYLMSSKADFNSSLNGYYLRVGGSSSDRLSLFSQTGSNTNLILESTDGYLNTSQVALKLRVERDNNLWSLLVDTGAVSPSFQSLALGVDSSHFSSSYFGVYGEYTKTRVDKFRFDNFKLSGKAVRDTQIPRVDTLIHEYKNKIQLFFNEDVEKISAEVLSNYSLIPSIGSPVAAVFDTISKRRVELEFNQALEYGVNYQLDVVGVKDLSANPSNSTEWIDVQTPIPKVELFNIVSSDSLRLHFADIITKSSSEDVLNYLMNNGLNFPSKVVQDSVENTVVDIVLSQSLKDSLSYRLLIQGVEDSLGYESNDTIDFIYYVIKENDVVINELMLDPNPVIGTFPNRLPEAEYVELYNRSEFSLQLQDWEMRIGDKEATLPEFIMKPESYLLLCSQDVANEFHDSLSILPLDISSTVLTNSANTITLFSNNGYLVNTVSYSDIWYSDENKADGGWSLELIDQDRFCGDNENWKACDNQLGGTPGFVNSISKENPDIDKPELLYTSVEDNTSMTLHFSEGIEIPFGINDFNIEPYIEVLNVEISYDRRESVQFVFKDYLKENTIYQLTFGSSFQDCNGNNTLVDTVYFGLPSIPDPEDILINEVLFDPVSGGSDFVEIVNVSDKIVDLSKLRLGNWDAGFNEITNAKALTEESYLLLPGKYLVFTANSDFVINNYSVQDHKSIINVADLPSMDDTEGSIAISTSDLNTIDFFEYLDDYHLSVIEDNEGVSLERINLNAKAQEENNWHSASSVVGFATPGYLNSQYFQSNNTMGIEVEPKVFTPNQDGYQDFVSFSYSFQNIGNVLSVNIWNTVGNRLRVLMENESVSQDGVLHWNGLDDDGNLLNSGIYIVTFDHFNTDGTVEKHKRACVISR